MSDHHSHPEFAHIAIFLPQLGGGGIGRSMLNLAGEFAGRGHRVDLVLGRAAGPYVREIPDPVRVFRLQRARIGGGRLSAIRVDPGGIGGLLIPILFNPMTSEAILYLDPLARYLRDNRPEVLLTADHYGNLIGIWARRLAGVRLKVVLSEHTDPTRSVMHARTVRTRFLAQAMRRNYPRADAIIAVSNGVAEGLSKLTSLLPGKVTSIYNPVVSPELIAKASAPLDDPWFKPGNPPVILGAGRLKRQKDFPTLIRAFARVHKDRQARLIILGQGRLRAPLLALTRSLGVAADISLPGFVANPLAYMARAKVFVLSSAWEGLGDVLIEAMACGCPVVSSDCPSGPAEILEGGEYGPLVAVGDDRALAEEIIATLDNPPDRARLRRRAAEFSVKRAADRYLDVMLGGSRHAPTKRLAIVDRAGHARA